MLEQVRKLFGYTQDELAKGIGISQNYYTQIETGKAKSAPVIGKLSRRLNIAASFLMSRGEYYEYPFLADLYFFNLTEQRIFQSYKFIIEYICSRSRYIDIVFFLLRKPPSEFLSRSPIFYIAIRDDHRTLFVFRRRSKMRRHAPGDARVGSTRTAKEEEIRVFPLVDLFREELHKLPYIYENTFLMDDQLFDQFEKEEIARKRLLSFFPDAGYFYKLYELHKGKVL
jgi:transcriptional regulator with XRE-family HTH domain